MKKLKTKNIYKASNVTFDADKIEAFSYGWWRFVAVIDGKVHFNRYKYSYSTARHQSRVLSLMEHLGIGVAVWHNTREGLQEGNNRGIEAWYA